MAFYTVHLPLDAEAPDQVAEIATFVKEGFAVFGFAFGGLWLLYQRLWLHAIGYALMLGLVLAAFRYFSIPLQAYGLVTMLMGALVGLEGNEWKRRDFARKGWMHEGTVSGPSLAECERRFFKNWLEKQTQEKPAQVSAAPRQAASFGSPSPNIAQPAVAQVLGVFPQARDRA
jgi:Protein of unknown function (DUF2628)